MKRVTILFAPLSLAICLTTAGQSQPGGSMEMYQAKPPTPGADPDQRHAETFQVPMRLQIDLRDGKICVGDDPSSLVSVPISVGKLMTVGVEASRFYYAGVERKHVGGKSIGTACGSGTLCGPRPEVLELAATQGFVQFLEELTVFETDLPAQHMWDPEKGRYRVLWRGIAVGTYQGKK